MMIQCAVSVEETRGIWPSKPTENNDEELPVSGAEL